VDALTRRGLVNAVVLPLPVVRPIPSGHAPLNQLHLRRERKTAVKHASVALIVVLSLLSTSAASGQTSSRQEFEEFCKLVQGRWVNENSNLVPPSNDAAAKPMMEYGVNEIAVDGHALDSTWYLGELTAKWLTVWDAGTSQIREFFVMSDGTTAQSVMAKKDGKWVRTATMTAADGKKINHTSTLVDVSADGRTHTWTDTRFDGKSIYRRVPK